MLKKIVGDLNSGFASLGIMAIVMEMGIEVMCSFSKCLQLCYTDIIIDIALQFISVWKALH